MVVDVGTELSSQHQETNKQLLWGLWQTKQNHLTTVEQIQSTYPGYVKMAWEVKRSGNYYKELLETTVQYRQAQLYPKTCRATSLTGYRGTTICCPRTLAISWTWHRGQRVPNFREKWSVLNYVAENHSMSYSSKPPKHKRKCITLLIYQHRHFYCIYLLHKTFWEPYVLFKNRNAFTITGCQRQVIPVLEHITV